MNKIGISNIQRLSQLTMYSPGKFVYSQYYYYCCCCCLVSDLGAGLAIFRGGVNHYAWPHYLIGTSVKYWGRINLIGQPFPSNFWPYVYVKNKCDHHHHYLDMALYILRSALPFIYLVVNEINDPVKYWHWCNQLTHSHQNCWFCAQIEITISIIIFYFSELSVLLALVESVRACCRRMHSVS